MSINKILDSDIEQIKQRIEELVDETKIQYATSYQVLLTNNLELAKKSIDNEKKINSLQNQFTSIALWKIAKQQMVAGDLRLSIGSILIAREIEVIADYALWMCKFFVKYQPTAEENADLTVMFELIVKMLDLVSNLMENYDINQKSKVIALKKELNKKFEEISLKLLYKTQEVKDENHAILLLAEIRQINNLERAGDHLINIQEILTFIRTGRFEDMGELPTKIPK